MTPEAQRVAILTVMRWTELSRTGRRGEDGPVGALRGTDPLGRKGRYAPNPVVNLNAMHEAEKILDVEPSSPDSPRYRYSRLLYDIVPKSNQPFRATAAQRARAFLETLNLWKP